jgi:hypothetical protein
MRLKKTHNTALIGLVLCTSFAFAADQKPEEIVAKHLDSIGTAQARSAAVSRVVEGKAEFKMLVGGGGTLDGKSVLVSQGDKVQLMMKFPNNDYRGEQFISDGDHTQVAATTSNHTRSNLGEFVRVQDVMLREGLLGGVLSKAWPLANLDEHKAKLSYAGMKKMDGKQLIELRYKPKKSSDLDISLYFDPDTYHHVMTVYSYSQRGGLGHINEQISNAVPTGDTLPGDLPTGGVVPESSETRTARQQETRYRLEERFSDFQTDKGLTLPQRYTIHFSQELSNGHTTVSEWDIAAVEIINGNGVDPGNFRVK